MSNTAWDRFKDSLDRGITGPADLESLDLVALSQLNDLERERARQLLEVKLGDGDPRIVDALAAIDSAKSWADVERAFNTEFGSALIHAGMQLWRKNQDPRVIPRLKTEVFNNPDAPTHVIEALLALAKIPGEEVDDILVEALTTSKQPRVVIAAREQLYYRLKWSQWEHEGSPLFSLTMGMRSPYPSVRNQSFDQLRDLVRRKRAGETDAQLGLVAQPLPQQRSPELLSLLQLAFRPAAAPLPDVAAIDALQGGERVWAVDLLLARLEQGDTRVIPLLERLGGDRIQMALDDHRAGRKIP
jgi:hypothetical protein